MTEDVAVETATEDEVKPRPWDIFKNSFEVLYPAELTWMIGGRPFVQRELGWVELVNVRTKIADIINKSLYLGVLRADDMLFIENDLKATSMYVFVKLMDRRVGWYTSRLFGKESLPIFASLTGKPIPPMYVNTELFAIILRTEEVEFLDKYMTPDMAENIRVSFLKQNDINMILESLEPQEIDEDEPSLGNYLQYVDLKLSGIDIEDSWSPRKIDRVYTVLRRKKEYEKLEKAKTRALDRLGEARRQGAEISDHQERILSWKYDMFMKAALYGTEDDEESEWGW